MVERLPSLDGYRYLFLFELQTGYLDRVHHVFWYLHQYGCPESYLKAAGSDA